MKNKDNKNYIKAGLTIFISLSGVVLFYFLMFYGADLKVTILKFLSVFTSVFLGCGIAYLLNPLMKSIEKNIVEKLLNIVKKKKIGKTRLFEIKRGISVLLTMIVFILILYGLIILIVPQVIESIQNIIIRVPTYLTNLNSFVYKFVDEAPIFKEFTVEDWNSITNYFTSSVVPTLQNFVSAASSSVFSGVFGVVNGLFNFIIGTIISIYLLYNKELFLAQGKKILYALLNEERANNLINNTRYTHKVFGGFISGKLVDSLIIGIICYICMLILKMPYAALISVIVGVTNIIPYFGPIIGAIPSAIIVLMVDPMKALYFIICIVILQQFDGNILGPKILGGSTGLNGFWVIFAITVFSGLFGVMGMFIGVPVFAVIYAGIKTFVNERLDKKNMPVSTNFYKDNDYHTQENYKKNVGKELRFTKRTPDNQQLEDQK